MIKESTKEILTSCEFILVCIITVGVVVGVTVTWYLSLDDTEILMDDEIIKAEVIDGKDYNYFFDLVRITTENDIYILNFGDEDKIIDLTVNSKLILKLYNDGSNDVWQVKKIYKMPG